MHCHKDIHIKTNGRYRNNYLRRQTRYSYQNLKKEKIITQNRITFLTHKQGELIGGIAEKLGRWVEHFKVHESKRAGKKVRRTKIALKQEIYQKII